MANTPKYWNKAKRHLSKKDKTIAKLIKHYQSPSETILTSRKDIFFSLCKSIIGQQISVAAANSVFLKFKKKCGNKINPKKVSKLTFYQIKSCGLSRQKVLGIKKTYFNPVAIQERQDHLGMHSGLWAIKPISIERNFGYSASKKVVLIFS